MDYYDNPYYAPEVWGWRMIDSIDFGASYEFDIYAFFTDVSGYVRFGNDSGCSCPEPFDSYRGPDDFEVLTKERWQQVKAEMRYSIGGDVTYDEVHRVVSKVEEALRAN